MIEIQGQLNAAGMKVGIVVSRFNDFLTGHLLSGATDCLLRHGIEEEGITVVRVPGANEIPQVVQRLAASDKVDGVIALGVVVQGATAHADLINSQVSRSLAGIALECNRPVINGVVCAPGLEQAIERCGTKAGNKGWDAALALIEMVDVVRKI